MAELMVDKQAEAALELYEEQTGAVWVVDLSAEVTEGQIESEFKIAILLEIGAEREPLAEAALQWVWVGVDATLWIWRQAETALGLGMGVLIV